MAMSHVCLLAWPGLRRCAALTPARCAADAQAQSAGWSAGCVLPRSLPACMHVRKQRLQVIQQASQAAGRHLLSQQHATRDSPSPCPACPAPRTWCRQRQRACLHQQPAALSRQQHLLTGAVSILQDVLATAGVVAADCSQVECVVIWPEQPQLLAYQGGGGGAQAQVQPAAKAGQGCGRWAWLSAGCGGVATGGCAGVLPHAGWALV
jgi:hypothetical protein